MPKKWFLWFVYHNPFGLPFRMLFRMKWFSEMSGVLFSTPLSRYLIPLLMKVYGIKLDTYETPEGGFSTVNDFFIRSSHRDFRHFPREETYLWSPADSCVEIFQGISSVQDFCVKGYHANLLNLFWPKISEFSSGDICFCRLRFSDYHHFHFFDEGEILGTWEREWPLYSVDNSVLDTGLWVQNKSHLTHLHTVQFWDVLWLEVWATNVGSIVNHKVVWSSFSRGEEKWYFQLGGSAVLIAFQKWKIQWRSEILTMNADGKEYEVVTGWILGHAYWS